MMGKKFYWMHKDLLCTEIEVCYDENIVKFTNFVEDPLLCAFGVSKSPCSIKKLYKLLETRFVPERDGYEILTYRGCNLPDDPTLQEILTINHGMLVDDFFWIKGTDEMIDFDELRKLLGIDCRKRLPLKKLHNIKFTDKEKFGINSLVTRASQDKWIYKGWFIKEDTAGAESMAEVLVNTLIKCCTNLDCIDYVLLPQQDMTKGICASPIYTDACDIEFVPVWTIIEKTDNVSKIKNLVFDNPRDMVDLITNITSSCLKFDTMPFLHKMLYLDAIILNTDRHFNNMAFKRNKDMTYSLLPLFDHGLSLQPTLFNRPVVPRIFCDSFEDLITALDNNYRLCIDIEKFTNIIRDLDSYYSSEGYYSYHYYTMRDLLLERLWDTKSKAWYPLEESTIVNNLVPLVKGVIVNYHTYDSNVIINKEEEDIVYGNRTRKK